MAGLDGRRVPHQSIPCLGGYFSIGSAMGTHPGSKLSLLRCNPLMGSERVPPRHGLYCPSIPFFRSALGGLGPSHTEKSTGPKAGPVMVSFSAPLMAKVVPVPGT